MPGFSNITGLESIMYADNASFDGTERGGRMIADGQVWIGASSSPHVRLSNLTSGNNITFTNGPGSITANVTGTTNHAIQIGNASGSLTSAAVLTNGQLLIGSTGADPVAVTLTAGAGITITNSAGGITIAATGGSVVPNLTYIGTTATTSGTAVNYTNLSNTYKGYRFYYEKIDPDASTLCVIQLSTDGGGSYDSTATNYITNATSTRSGLGVDMGVANPNARSGYVDVYFTNTANATVTSYSRDAVDQYTESFASYYTPLSNVNALRFVWESGANFTAGNIVQYGIS